MNYFPGVLRPQRAKGARRRRRRGGSLRKVALLERTGASISVVAPEIAPGTLCSAPPPAKSDSTLREFVPADLDGARLVIVATSRRAVNRWIANLSESRDIPVNVVDDREASRFIVPAIIDRDPVLVAISTGGTSPVLARRLRERLEALIPQRIGDLALWLRGTARKTRGESCATPMRGGVFSRPSSTARRRGASSRATSPGAARIAQQLLATSAAAPPAAGEVTLVGAGPGRPGTVDAQGAARAAGCGCHSARSLGVRRHSRSGAARCAANLRGQGRRRRRQHARGNQRLADRTSRARASGWCVSRAAIPSSSGAAEKSCRHWRQRRSIFRWCPASPRLSGALPMRAFR